MKDVYTKDMVIQYSDIDMTGCLNIFRIPMISQDLATEYFRTIGTSNDILRENDDAAWIFTKYRIHAGKMPFWQEKLLLKIYFTKIDSVRIYLEIDALYEDGNPAFTGIFEGCAIDLDSRTIRRISTVTFPENVAVYDGLVPTKFEKIKTDFNGAEISDEIKIHWSDIDFTGHTNNACYVNYLLRTIDSGFLLKNRITDIRLQYIKETRQDDRLQIFRRNGQDCLEFLIRKDDDEILKAVFSYIPL